MLHRKYPPLLRLHHLRYRSHARTPRKGKGIAVIFEKENINTLTEQGEMMLIVELKAPRVILSKKVLRQIEDYMDFVRKQPSFNSEYRRWKFIAVCKEVDEDVKGRYKTFEDRGKVGLVHEIDNYEVYALTWDDIFKSFELRHAPLLKRLNYDREKLAEELMNEVKHEDGRNKVNMLRDIAVNEVGDLT